MTGILLAMKSLSGLFETMQKLKDMEKETKTITLPYSEFLELQNIKGQYLLTRDSIIREVEIKYKDEIVSLTEELDSLNRKYLESRMEVNSLQNEIRLLKLKIKSRRWWEIWKI